MQAWVGNDENEPTIEGSEKSRGAGSTEASKLVENTKLRQIMQTKNNPVHKIEGSSYS